MSKRTLLLLAILPPLFFPLDASAQAAAERAGELLHQAQTAYFELSMDDALRFIDEAIEICHGGACTPSELARLHVTQGVILHGATGDEAAARSSFDRAFAIDSQVGLDSMLSNPELERLFEESRDAYRREHPDLGPASAASSASATSTEERPPMLASSGSRAETRDADTGPWNRVFFELGYSLTLASAQADMRAASSPDVATPGDDPQSDAIAENDSYYLPGTHGCDAPAGEYCVRVNQGLTAFAHGLHAGAGVFVTERFGIAARIRYSPNAGEGTLSHFLLGLRGHYRFIVPRRTGFHASLFGGFMVGQIQVRPKQYPTPPATNIDRPWVRTGLGGLEVGGKLGYRFHPNVGVFASPELYVLVPDFSFGLQATVGIDMSFGSVGDAPAPEPAPEPEEVDDDPDRDGIVSSLDRCPNEAEDRDGFEDSDGCPDADNDGDTILDAADRCPDAAEDADGFEDEDGCPDLDDDGDGVPDTLDACPRDAGPSTNEGCPLPDRDEDGVADRFDNCPDEPGPPENMGCVVQQLVQIEEERLRILDMIYFRRNGHVIERRSYALLEQLAAVMNAHPEIAHIRVEGHTDSTGSARYNTRLSQRRADSVMRHLTRRGRVDRHRLSAHGYGSERPITPNATTDEEHAQNRRVEFVILNE